MYGTSASDIARAPTGQLARPGVPPRVASQGPSVNAVGQVIFDRVLSLVKQTSDIAYFLAGPTPENPMSTQEKVAEPSLVERLIGIDQLLGILQQNISRIDAAVR